MHLLYGIDTIFCVDPGIPYEEFQTTLTHGDLLNDPIVFEILTKLVTSHLVPY